MPDSDVDDIAPIQRHSTLRTKSGESSHMGSTLATPVSGQRQSSARVEVTSAPRRSSRRATRMAQEKITSAYQEIGVEDANDNEPQVGIQEIDYEVDEEYEADDEAYEEIDEVNLSDDSEDDELALLHPHEADLSGFEDIGGDDPMNEDTEETSDGDEPVNSRRTRGKKAARQLSKIKILK